MLKPKDPEWASLEDIADAVRKGEQSAVELVTKAIRLAKEHQEFNAILELNEEASLERAKEIDEQAKSEDLGSKRLLGVPYIAKDNFLTYATETTAASKILKGFKAPYQSTVIEKVEAEGAILIGKANLDAFAHGASTEHSDFGPTLNPHDKSKVSGGSSGGPAAAVALGIVPFSLATDTGGSIRQPASFSGVVGLKPTYGLVSRFGVIAMASSTDVIGPITKTVEDAALVLDIIAGQDWKDGTTIRRDKSYILGRDSSKPAKKLGLIQEFLGMGISEEVKDSILNATTLLSQSHLEIEKVSVPVIEHSLAVYYIIVPAEISSNLARYDGIKFGYSHHEAKDLDEVYDLSRSKGFGYEAKRRIMIGTYVLSSGYYDAYYKKAQQVRTLIIEGFNKAFEQHEVLIGPVAPTTAFKLGENVNDPLQMYLADVMTAGVSLAGLPAISVPIKPSANLPVGLQIIGRQGADKQVLETAKLVEELMS